MLSSFEEPEKGIVNIYQPQCSQEYHVKPTGNDFLRTPELGRSGWELRNMYKLSGMEKVGDDFFNRQLAVHHCFDFSTGRSVFLTLKANHKKILDQITEINKNAVPHSLASSFVTSLETQLVSFHWSVAGWKAFVNKLEHGIHEISQRIRNIPMSGDDEKNGLLLLRSQTFRESQGLGASPGSQTQSPQRQSSFNLIKTTISGNIKNGGPAPGPSGDEKVAEKLEKLVQSTMERTIEKVRKLQDFPFDHLQTLNSICKKLKEAKFIMGSNARVLQQTRQFYQRLFEDPGCPAEIKNACPKDLECFQIRIEQLEKRLLTGCSRIDALIEVAADAQILYDSILQLKSAETNNLFAMDALSASVRMESSTQRMEEMTRSMNKIAESTEKDTGSMHFMTFFALIFLPGTFLGVRLLLLFVRESSSPAFLTEHTQSFFSTPIFGDSEEGSPQSWIFHKDLFVVFIIICLIMMVITLSLWGLYLRAQKLRRKQLQEYNEAASSPV
ncbi:unnamed protein product [Clonostachys solani]|uniref:CorA-like transporter domain-containing protein n=1 Tax=Clonostachys solani TaxID=160281 RepID=A0A9P0EJ28_9HYPO|nr:unnamed protein product [Clonostachys solani]